MKGYAAAVAVILSMLLIACGSSDSEPAAEKAQEEKAPVGLTKAEFVAQTNEYCAKMVKDLEGLKSQMASAGASNDYQAISDVYSQLSVRGKALVKEIETLDYEGEDADTVNSFVDAARSLFKQSGRLGAAMGAEDMTQISGVSGDFERANGQMSGLAQSLGLDECELAEN